MNSKITLLAIATALFVSACGGSSKQASEKDVVDSTQVAPIILTKAPPSPKYPDAKLSKVDVKVLDQDSTFAIDYKFDVKNYELGVQTEDAATRGIANSGKGQHIHFIVNNGPYSAHYMPGVMNNLDEGNYVVLAFLSRSYHESVKSADAFYVENLTVGDGEPKEEDLTAAHLFYSRPKGVYTGEDTQKVMLDFYLLNTTISPDGNKVKATINGEEFMITEWAPYYIEGLPLGDATIKLELIDAEGKTIDGPFNKVKRTITLE